MSGDKNRLLPAQQLQFKRRRRRKTQANKQLVQEMDLVCFRRDANKVERQLRSSSIMLLIIVLLATCHLPATAKPQADFERNKGDTFRQLNAAQTSDSLVSSRHLIANTNRQLVDSSEIGSKEAGQSLNSEQQLKKDSYDTNKNRLMEFQQKYIANRAISDKAYYILLLIYALFILVGAVSNSLICLAVIMKPKILSPRNIFIVNLAGSDLLLCVFTMPFSFIEISMKMWHLGLILCKLTAGLQATSIFVSTISITAIALDRYKVIVYPTHQEKTNGTRSAALVLASVWICALLLSLPLFRFRTVEHVDLDRIDTIKTMDFCIEAWPFAHGRGIYSVISMMFQYFIPITIVSVVYVKLSDKLQKRLIRRLRITQLECQQKRQLNLIKKTHNMLISVSLIFGLSWLPLNLLNVIGDFTDLFKGDEEMFRVVFAICHLIGCSSACSNPILYGYLNENFRKEFHQVYTHRLHRLMRFLRRIFNRSQTSDQQQTTPSTSSNSSDTNSLHSVDSAASSSARSAPSPISDFRSAEAKESSRQLKRPNSASGELITSEFQDCIALELSNADPTSPPHSTGVGEAPVSESSGRQQSCRLARCMRFCLCMRGSASASACGLLLNGSKAAQEEQVPLRSCGARQRRRRQRWVCGCQCHGQRDSGTRPRGSCEQLPANSVQTRMGRRVWLRFFAPRSNGELSADESAFNPNHSLGGPNKQSTTEANSANQDLGQEKASACSDKADKHCVNCRQSARRQRDEERKRRRARRQSNIAETGRIQITRSGLRIEPPGLSQDAGADSDNQSRPLSARTYYLSVETSRNWSQRKLSSEMSLSKERSTEVVLLNAVDLDSDWQVNGGAHTQIDQQLQANSQAQLGSNIGASSSNEQQECDEPFVGRQDEGEEGSVAIDKMSRLDDEPQATEVQGKPSGDVQAGHAQQNSDNSQSDNSLSCACLHSSCSCCTSSSASNTSSRLNQLTSKPTTLPTSSCNSDSISRAVSLNSCSSQVVTPTSSRRSSGGLEVTQATSRQLKQKKQPQQQQQQWRPPVKNDKAKRDLESLMDRKIDVGESRQANFSHVLLSSDAIRANTNNNSNQSEPKLSNKSNPFKDQHSLRTSASSSILQDAGQMSVFKPEATDPNERIYLHHQVQCISCETKSNSPGDYIRIVQADGPILRPINNLTRSQAPEGAAD